MKRRRIVATALLSVAFALLGAAPALATFHLIKVREVFPGAPGAESGFVMLQMYESGQNEVGGHILTLYGADGTLLHTTTLDNDVANSANQSTILIGDSNVGTVLRVDPDFVDPDLNIPAAGGAACWNSDGDPSDCVSWGNFTGNGDLSNNAGSPAQPGGIDSQDAILRRISPGCSTLLEPGDDSDDSATDFAVVHNAVNPRNNASPVVETPCAGLPPDTAIDEKPEKLTTSHVAMFTYGAPTATSFQCRLDAAPFQGCANTGRTFNNVPDGTHTFEVRGENASGPDQTPASYTWTVDSTAPTSVIDTHPADPSPGATAAFTYHGSETIAEFECSLALQGSADSFAVCPAGGKTYVDLAEGTYLFKLRATDPAGNVQATPTTFTWTVDNDSADTTPPETSIANRPPDPSTSATASFTYTANEAGSRFECALDAAAFAACPTTGVSFTGLANGPHTFKVRAIDPSGNVDATPAAYTFSVAVPSTPPPPKPPTNPQPQPPQTQLGAKPASRTHDSTPTFRFSSTTPGTTFQCAVDKGKFKPCRSPFTAPKLEPGRHTFAVKAVRAGQADATPAKFSFTVLKGG